MPFEVTPPKYMRVILAVQERIEDGTYAPGSMLPSEHQFATEFGVSRPTVVKALDIMVREGWLRSEQGTGRFVRARPAEQHQGRGAVVLDADEAGEVSASAGPVVAPDSVADLLGLEPGTPVLRRRRLVSDADGPMELVTSFFPLDVAEGTELSSGEPIRGGVRRHLERRKKLHIDRATDSITARLASEDEAKLLELEGNAPVLRLWVVAFEASGRALYASEVVLPGERHELEDTYALR